MVTINIRKKDLWIFAAIIVFGVGATYVMAVWNSDDHPVSHLGDDLKVTISGTDYSLQEAIDTGLFGGGGGSIPSGVIVMWSGALADVPAGWRLCDGTGGTPNLRDKFIYGWTAGVNPGGTGGVATHSHDEGSYSVDVPTHTHTYSLINHQHPFSGTTNEVPDSQLDRGDIDSVGWDYYAGSHDHTYSGTTAVASGFMPSANTGSGGSSPLNGFPVDGTSALATNVPPYYKLAFIMKMP